MTQIAKTPSENDLQAENSQLINQVQNLTIKNLELEATNAQLMDYLRLAKQNRFGSKSEKIADDDTPMFPGIGQVFDEASVEMEPKKPAKKRAAQGGRKPFQNPWRGLGFLLISLCRNMMITCPFIAKLKSGPKI